MIINDVSSDDDDSVFTDADSDVETGINPDACSNPHRLLMAARYGNLTEIYQFSSTCNVQDISKALCVACHYGQHNVVQWILRHTDADANYCNRPNTPLTTACSHGFLDIVRLLIDSKRVDVNLPCKRTKQTPLTVSCYNSQKHITNFLLREVDNVGINTLDFYDNTALHYVIWCRQKDMTPLHLVSGFFADENKIGGLLQQFYNDINAQDNNGDTPLHRVCQWGNISVLRILMASEADETITNDDGETPAQSAVTWGHPELVEQLDRNIIVNVYERLRKFRPLRVCAVLFLAMSLLSKLPVVKRIKFWQITVIKLQNILTLIKQCSSTRLSLHKARKRIRLQTN